MKYTDLRAYALSLPEVSEEPHHTYGSFRVRGKIFATVPPGEEFVHVFVDDERRALALAMNPKAYEDLRWGKRIVGLRILLSEADLADVEDLLDSAWRLKAPDALLNQADKDKNHTIGDSRLDASKPTQKRPVK